MIANYLKIAWKVLLRHPFYTFITLFGITLTLTVLMVLTSFMDHLFAAHYPENKRDRSLYITQVVLKDSVRSGHMMNPLSFKFLNEYAKTLKNPERVGIASMFSFSNTYINGKRINLNTKYTDADFWYVTDFDFVEGKPYDEKNVENGDRVVVITDGLRDQYFDTTGETVVGKYIEIESVNYRVIGVVKGSPPTRLYTYSDVYFPYTSPKSNYQDGGITGRYMAFVLGSDRSDLPAMQAEFDQTIDRIPRPVQAGGYSYSSMNLRAYKYLDHFLNTLLRSDSTEAKLFFYSVVSLVVLMFMGLPALNLINVNVSRMLERSSEIGVRKAFGAPARVLLGQFIVENIFITLIGGLFALGLSFAVIKLINAAGWIAYSDLTINWTVFAVSVGVSLLFGLLSGVLPALRMSKLTIVEALKS